MMIFAPEHGASLADGFIYRVDTDHYMQNDAGMSLEQPKPKFSSPRTTKYKLRHNPKPNRNGDYRY